MQQAQTSFPSPSLATTPASNSLLAAATSEVQPTPVNVAALLDLEESKMPQVLL